MVDLKGKVAIVTGAASGIGKAVALALADKGCNLTIVDIDERGLEECLSQVKQKNIEAISMSFDCSKKEAWQTCKERVIDNFDRLDVLVNNAGVALGRVKLEDVSEENFEWIMDINFWGMVHGVNVMLPELKQQEWACIANVSSVFGLMGIPFQVPYCSSKFAIRGFTEALAMEAKELYPNLNVLSIHPGGIDTNIVKNARWSENNTQEEIAKTNRMSSKTLITPAADIANSIVRSIEQNKSRLVSGNNAYLLDFLPRLFPASYSKIFSFLFAKKIKNK